MFAETLGDTSLYMKMFGIDADPINWEALANEWGVGEITDPCKSQVLFQGYTFVAWAAIKNNEHKQDMKSKEVQLDAYKHDVRQLDSIMVVYIDSVQKLNAELQTFKAREAGRESSQ